MRGTAKYNIFKIHTSLPGSYNKSTKFHYFILQTFSRYCRKQEKHDIHIWTNAQRIMLDTFYFPCSLKESIFQELQKKNK